MDGIPKYIQIKNDLMKRIESLKHEGIIEKHPEKGTFIKNLSSIMFLRKYMDFQTI